MPLHLVTAPTVEPITVDDVLLNSRIETRAEDAKIARDIGAARKQAEAFTRRAFITQTWDLKLDGFPATSAIELPYPPLQSVTSVSYYDSANSLTVWATSNYEVDAISGDHCEPGRLVLADGISWPTTYTRINAVIIRFVAGYGATAATVPEDIRSALLVKVGEMYERREEVIVGAGSTAVTNTFERLLWPYRMWLDPALDVS